MSSRDRNDRHRLLELRKAVQVALDDLLTDECPWCHRSEGFGPAKLDDHPHDVTCPGTWLRAALDTTIPSDPP